MVKGNRKQRRKSKSKKIEFIGWASKSLTEFLQSIGKDIGKELTHHNVTSIVNDYVRNFDLLHPEKKKRVVCDERLHALFGKKSFLKVKIHELLSSHFAENRESSDDDDLNESEGYGDVDIKCKKPKVSSQTEKESDTLVSRFAAIVPDNIKLLYLKRTLVQELVTQPELFEEKLLGSYVRIKSDPLDIFQKNSHQLHPVTGVKNVPGNGGSPKEILLQIQNMIKDVPIRVLSDADFTREEVEDLCQRVKDGLIRRPTIVEFEHKAQMLHEDITKHWIPKELEYLRNLIDRANEKGWRKELHGYLVRMKQLQTPSERSKLLTQVPKVTADVLEPESTSLHEQIADIQQSNDLPFLNNNEVLHPTDDLGNDQILPSYVSNVEEDDEVVVVDGFDKDITEPSKNVGPEEQRVENKPMPKTKSSGQTLDWSNVIELSDDEEETHEQVDENIWFYLDPQGEIQGPFSRTSLKEWSDDGYFGPDFKVWKDGQTPDCAILLSDII